MALVFAHTRKHSIFADRGVIGQAKPPELIGFAKPNREERIGMIRV